MPVIVRTVRHHDIGLQPERTGLAWSRSSLSMFIVGLLALHPAVVEESTCSLIASFLAVGMSVLMAIRARTRPRYDVRDEEVTTPVSMRFLIGTTIVVLTVSALEFIRIVLQSQVVPFLRS